jgi:hypothetical protein
VDCKLRKRLPQKNIELFSDLYGSKIAGSGSIDSLLLKFYVLNNILADPGGRAE